MSSLDPSVLFAALPFSLWQWLLVELAIVLAYVVFGIAGFGTALVAGPLLAGVLPLSQIIPLLVLLDFSASFGNWLPARRQIAVTELKRLLPCMLLGCALGAYGLLALRAELLMLALGVFVSLYALYALFLQPRGQPRWRATWALPFGVFGGLFGALFGSGGFLYALYLNGRLASKEQMRATQSALIGCSTFVRLGLFLLAGLYAAREPWLLAACLLPGMALGLWIGRRVTLRLSREAFVRLVTWLVLCSGLALVGRYLAG
ncbi:anion permease [Pseudomonas aeruginosa]|uniref:sulfite exporter TauE/SafE family protein n=1 Tax=Pseudomonas aeruginosa TaxID=287 RepID=UPI00071B90B5|nr:sulfite exporter TauE/SafE family protein [Pseudomonas aeruginosa]KSD11804.1 anion permease [Pseudomonas aeruginosa]